MLSKKSEGVPRAKSYEAQSLRFEPQPHADPPERRLLHHCHAHREALLHESVEQLKHLLPEIEKFDRGFEAPEPEWHRNYFFKPKVT